MSSSPTARVAAEAEDAAPRDRHRADWLYGARWGLCFHYLADAAGQRSAAAMTPEAWNRRVDAFDADRFAETVAGLGARYVLFTIGQNSGYYCSPNAAYERRVGRSPAESRLSRRDLMSDLADTLTRVGVRLCAYLPSHAPANDRAAIERLRCTPAWDARRWSFRDDSYTIAEGVDKSLTDFQRAWETIVREWSDRWGPRIHAWWIDGCTYPDRMYRGEAAPNFYSFADALRSGNPDALVAFNGGTRIPPASMTDAEDYTAGEANHLLVAEHGWRPRRWVDGKQLHVLTYLAEAWGRGRPRFDADLAASWTRHVNGLGGAVTWDVPIAGDGSIPEDHATLLKAITERIDHARL